MKVLITTIVSLNPGDAAILQGSLRLLQEAFGNQVQVTVFDKHGPAAAKYYPWADFRRSLFAPRPRKGVSGLAQRHGFAHRVLKWDTVRYRLGARLIQQGRSLLTKPFLSREEVAALAEYVEADLIISSGGTYLVEHYDMLRSILDYELALSLDKPLVFFPQSMGPFERTKYRQRLRRIFTSAVRVLVRDEQSAKHLERLGVPASKVFICPDAAFALEPEEPPRPRTRPGPLRIGVSVREWRHSKRGDATALQRDYYRMIAAGVTHLIRAHGAHITFISTCQGLPEYWADDSKTAREVVALLEPKIGAMVTIDSAFRQPTTLLAELTQFDAIIATRMHMAILALCGGIPVLPIAYEFKTRELFRGLGLEPWVTDIDNPDEKAFVRLIDSFVEALPEISGVVRSGVKQLKTQLSNLPAELSRLVPVARRE